MTRHSQDHSASVQLKQMLNPNAIQRMDEEEELLQGKFLTVQKKGLEEEELMQGKFEHSSMENDTGLPDNLKSGIENLSGFSMDDVKVHRNSDEPAKVQAHAFAQGTNIHLAPGQEKHLPHEAWHVVQQKQGRVKPTFQMKGQVNVNDDPGLETEADVMGAKAIKAMQQKDVETTLTSSALAASRQLKEKASSPLVQRNSDSVYQLQTRIYYAPPNNRAGNSVINRANHKRNLHNSTQRDLAAYHSGYINYVQAANLGTGICNHHVSYAAIANAVLDEIYTNTPNQNLDEAVAWINNTYNTNLQGQRNYHNGVFGFTFGGFPAANIPNLGGFGGAQYDEFTVEQEIDDIIFNLANDPQNLFYWPASTGGDPDRPTGMNNNNPLPNYNVTRQVLRGRLNQYRNYLRNTLGLNIP
ncbi:DUF4157 domain-containing protein [Maribellus luteus]|uniref:DUF4157 domain-containing protein n=2 Tax=Maribellus luteus TaxID=2305463 RepID=A0A399T9M0_9BACT|nr:DUF4157 domain-containing protein [Maribellus luteus]